MPHNNLTNLINMTFQFRYSQELKCKIHVAINDTEKICINHYDNGTVQIFKEPIQNVFDFYEYKTIPKEVFYKAYINAMIDLGLMDIMKSLGFSIKYKIDSYATIQTELSY
jgi:hypothetical protein